MSHELRFRQVHLDFHTPETIPGIGADFDPDRFVATLREAAVDSITCFSRCHHGWIYHDTRLPYRHPDLRCNLLAEQIRACHAADIRVPIYITVGWDDLMARLHPEWVEVDENGRRVGRSPLGSGGWLNMDFASPYVDFVIEQTQEVLDIFGDEVDGLFFDIIFQQGVHSPACLERFRSLGWDPADPVRQAEMRELLTRECTDRIYGAVREKNRECTVFFNSGHVDPAFRKRLGNYTHLELESLPTGGWGYMHFPITSRYARTLGHDFLGMTGKFSETWGHFNSYKNPAALEYECFQSLAQGGKCSVGDQLHPRGVLDPATYRLIGHVYRQVREREPWCVGARAVTEIAVMNAEPFGKTPDRMDPRNVGVARMLMETRHQFDFVDAETNLEGYRVLILPDVIELDERLRARVASFLASGGALIASGTSGLGSDLADFPAVADGGELPYSPDFVRLVGEETDYVMYERGQKVRVAEGAEVLATVTKPYFNRTWEHFCSHAHTPPAQPTDTPAVIAKGSVVYFAHPIFTTYARHSMSIHREMVAAALTRLLPEPLVTASGPSTLQATVTRQGDRRVVHLLHYIPERRGLNFDIVEEPIPVHLVRLSLAGGAESATLQPQGQPLEVENVGGRAVVTVPVVDGHQMVVFE